MWHEAHSIGLTRIVLKRSSGSVRWGTFGALWSVASNLVNSMKNRIFNSVCHVQLPRLLAR